MSHRRLKDRSFTDAFSDMAHEAGLGCDPGSEEDAYLLRADGTPSARSEQEPIDLAGGSSADTVNAKPCGGSLTHHEENFGYFLTELESSTGPEDGPGPMLSDAVGQPSVKEESFSITPDRSVAGGGGAGDFGVPGHLEAGEPAYATLASALPVSYYPHFGTPPMSSAVHHPMYNPWTAAAGFESMNHYLPAGGTQFGFHPASTATLPAPYYPLPSPYHPTIGQEHGVQPLEQTTDIKQRCDDEAYELVTRTKNVQGHRLRNLKNLDLITKLTGMLVQIRTLAENKASPFEFSCIQESLRDLKSTIHSTNVHAYENNVETHVNHILSGLSQLGNLNAFQYSHPPSVAQLL